MERERKKQEERRKTDIPMIGALRAQEYALTMFQPHLSFTLKEEVWEVSEPQTFNKFGLRHPRFELQLESNTIREGLDLEFDAVGWVFDSDRPSSREVVEAPRNMVAWLQKHPYLEAERLTKATIGGIDGNQIDISISRDAPKDPDSSWLPLWPVYYSDFYKGTNPREFHLSDGFEYRVTVLDIKGKTITISVMAHEGYLDEVYPRASEVLESIRWQT